MPNQNAAREVHFFEFLEQIPSQSEAHPTTIKEYEVLNDKLDKLLTKIKKRKEKSSK